MQCFWFLSYVPEPLSLAAQTLIARDRKHAREWAGLLLKSGAALGVLLAALLAVCFQGAALFSPDIAVQQLVKSVTLHAMAAMIVCAVMMMGDGISVGSNDFNHLPLTNCVALATTAAVLQAVQRAGVGYGGTWLGLIGFYLTRVAGHAWHFRHMLRGEKIRKLA